MATKLDAWPEITWGRPRSAAYPWDEWADGSVWQLEAGEDFQVKPESFRAHCYAQAERMGLRAFVSVKGEKTVIVQFRDRSSESPFFRAS